MWSFADTLAWVLPALFSKDGGAECYQSILDSEPNPDTEEFWDRSETLGKVRAVPGQVIRKDRFLEKRIIYSEDGSFPILGPETGEPPDDLQWQKTPLHGLLINGSGLLKQALEIAIAEGTSRADEFDRAYKSANEEAQASHPDPPKSQGLSTAEVWLPRTALFLIRCFATAIG